MFFFFFFFHGLWSELTRPNNSCGVVLSKPSPLRSLPAPLLVLVCSPSCLRSFGRVNTSPPEPSLSPPQAPVLKRRYLPGIPRIPTRAELTHHLATVSIIMVGSCTERNVTVNPTYGSDLNPSAWLFNHTNGKLLPNNAGCSQVTKDVVQTPQRVMPWQRHQLIAILLLMNNNCLLNIYPWLFLPWELI